jgi:hypothetical protein
VKKNRGVNLFRQVGDFSCNMVNSGPSDGSLKTACPGVPYTRM